MDEMGEGSIAILPAAPVRVRNRDVEYPYRQDSDFYYLTGFAEPDSVAVLVPGRSAGQYLLFCRDRDPQREIWDGYRAGPEGAVEAYGADDAFPIDDIDEILPGILESCERVYYTMGRTPEFDTRLIGWVNEIRSRGRTGVPRGRCCGSRGCAWSRPPPTGRGTRCGRSRRSGPTASAARRSRRRGA